MSDELHLNGKHYISSKRAAEETGYARDYIGQLARGGSIDAERVGGLWYVSLDSLRSYEKNAETARSFSPVASTKESESSLTFEGKEYISASRASKLTGYNQDYVGQLARAGKIPSRQIGNRWYVDSDALVRHKAEKDALLAAVQSESVGLKTFAEPVSAPIAAPPVVTRPQLTYMQESADLLPQIPSKDVSNAFIMPHVREYSPNHHPDVRKEPVKALTTMMPPIAAAPAVRRVPLKRGPRRINRSVVAALTIILVLSVGFTGMKTSGTLATIQKSENMAAMTAGAAEAVGTIGDMIENWVSPPLIYKRGQ